MSKDIYSHPNWAGIFDNMITDEEGDWEKIFGIDLDTGLESYISCDHVWNLYNGFTDSFEYCVKCDKKKESNCLE
ncbi:hypothetical protein EBZ38_07605 [bacterium]|nr:hypothetical protein [bacterium]